jgi:hypothetical protein
MIRYFSFLLAAAGFLPTGLAQTDDGLLPEQNPFRTERTYSSGPTYGFSPYAPQRRDYALDLGSMWENRALYWLGGTIGFHAGRCVFSASETCQNFVDLLGGVGGRDGSTQGLAAGSLRWQFIGFPRVVSPFARVFAGALRLRDAERDEIVPAYGLGYGITVTVHERMDLKLEARAGYGEQAFSQTFFSIGFRADKWIDYVARRIKGVGKGAVNATGTVIEKGIEATGTVIDKSINATKQGVQATERAAEKILDSVRPAPPRSSD